ncbi:DUF3995 domain-containing protein [Rhodococcus erythropolis]|uniref:DUF3995 domain-containing protein n=1 Tax=Rhodococcus erythropolis TaxID=1833 RepID=UPI002949572B|nr:DUF3995 domain-containing protein [Rhodococcus erythropolis]MDV6276534.1 DUF3995 domain-containing protein [Rhodococcus erythropolis]
MRTQALPGRSDTASVAFRVAAAAGLLHAAASLFWALGGRWQLESVGEWAAALAQEHPVRVGLALGLITLVKASAAVVPLLNERHRSRFHQQIRLGGWTGDVLLVGWGTLSSLSACAVLAGLVTPSNSYNRNTMIGHAFVWDPLFALWGGALLTGLWLTRTLRGEQS